MSLQDCNIGFKKECMTEQIANEDVKKEWEF
jgi:hypothetical protein